ncbi:hypothetical protein NMY22_g1472 [Coprinellus aureogranulatus]|nr:hypothetical protein NMY22_g1472 [Coprinellus aureogranulatus]
MDSPARGVFGPIPCFPPLHSSPLLSTASPPPYADPYTWCKVIEERLQRSLRREELKREALSRCRLSCQRDPPDNPVHHSPSSGMSVISGQASSSLADGGRLQVALGRTRGVDGTERWSYGGRRKERVEVDQCFAGPSCGEISMLSSPSSKPRRFPTPTAPTARQRELGPAASWNRTTSAKGTIQPSVRTLPRSVLSTQYINDPLKMSDLAAGCGLNGSGFRWDWWKVVKSLWASASSLLYIFKFCQWPTAVSSGTQPQPAMFASSVGGERTSARCPARSKEILSIEHSLMFLSINWAPLVLLHRDAPVTFEFNRLSQFTLDSLSLDTSEALSKQRRTQGPFNLESLSGGGREQREQVALEADCQSEESIEPSRYPVLIYGVVNTPLDSPTTVRTFLLPDLHFSLCDFTAAFDICIRAFRAGTAMPLKERVKRAWQKTTDIFKSRSPSPAPSTRRHTPQPSYTPERRQNTSTPLGQEIANEGDRANALPAVARASVELAAVTFSTGQTLEGSPNEVIHPRPIAATLQVPQILISDPDAPPQELGAGVQQELPIPGTTDVTPAPQSTASKGKSTWYLALQSTVALVERVSDVFPPLKSTAFSSNREEFEKLAKRVELLEEILKGRSTLPPDIRDRRDGLARAVESLGRELDEKMKASMVKRLVSVKEDQQEILRLIREISFAIEFAMLEVTVSNETMILRAVDGIGHSITELRTVREGISGIARGVANLNKAEQLKRLGNITDYEFYNKGQRGQCVPGSRVALLAQLLDWAEAKDSNHAFWLNGIAGTGKTAVAETLCSQLSDRGLLGASFFCSIKVQDLSDVHHIIPSLAKTLATTHPTFGDALVNILESQSKNPIGQMTLAQQYDFLILRPAAVAFQDYDKNIILCADALDECRNTAALKDFLESIISKAPTVPIKVFFTSRPELTIKREVEGSTHSSQMLRLHDIEKDIVRADIELYVSQTLKKVPELKDEYRDSWPPSEVEKIVEQSDCLFIVAATIVRDICSETGNPVERLKARGRVPKLSGIYDLYGGIMERAIAGLEPPEKQDLRACLSLLVVALRPLSLGEYAVLLGRPVSTIQATFKMLHSVVQLPTSRGNDMPISIHHASFVDFLTYIEITEMSGDVKATSLWTVQRQEAHFLVFERCLELMNNPKQGIHFGVSGAVTSYRSNDDQPCTLSLRSDLAYACTSWGNHALEALPLSEKAQLTVQMFLVDKGLYWLEALSTEKKIGYSSILWELSKGMALEGSGALLIAIRDFAQMFATPISHSAPHLYLSALPFYQAALGQLPWWSPNIPSIPAVHSTEGAKANQPRVLVRINARILCLAISPDGSQLISGDRQGLVRMWNAQSGELVWGNNKGHSDEVNSVAFSPDGLKVISGSSDSTIRVWDAKTGQPLGVLIEGHRGPVYSAVFSPDGSRIMSGSGDKTIRIWEALTGKALCDPIEGHAGDVNTVAFSPDSLKIISGSDDGTIRVWDAQNRQLVLGPLEGHTGAVLSVAVSSNGSRIVSGSQDRTIRVWDTQSGQDFFGPITGHSSYVRSVAFSPDGSKIVSGSDGRTIRLWDAQTGQAVGRPMEGRLHYVRAVTFTPDGLKIISGSSDGTIRIWDLQGDHTAEDLGHCHSGSVTSVAYSPDGLRIVSGSNDKTLRVWDAKTGQALVGPMEGHSEAVISVAFSPDGTRIVSGSEDQTIRVWDAQSGATVLGPLQDHSEWVLSVAFSPDGSLIASGSRDHTIQLWDAETGQPFLDRFKGHTDWVRSISFSPSSTRLVSGSDDRTVRVWDVQSGQVVLGPLHGHESHIFSVTFSPDGSRIASGSSDKTIQVWDAHNGTLLLDPLEVHSDLVWSVTFSPDGLKIASGSDDKTICIWDAQSGELICTLRGHTADVRSVSFSPDGTRIVSGSNDRTIRVWNLDQAVDSKPSFLHHYPAASFVMDEDGWIRNASQDLLLWVPPQFRPSIFLPPAEYVIGPSTTIELSHANYYGSNWRRCIEPPKQHEECPWPYTQ